MPRTITVADVIQDPAASYWLKDALTAALRRDPVDAARDAHVLLGLLEQRVTVVLGGT